jgi:Zn finger protein HypA/HybF involved in hydrogenase expression
MAMIITCTNKGCFKSSEALLDLNTNEVICRECGNPIQQVTSFAKVSLKSLGQTTKGQKKVRQLEFDCLSCNKKVQPMLKNGKIICSECKKEMENVPTTFKHVVEMIGKKEL